MAGAYLPEHIIYQIFLRMPIKPVVRLKRLSKQWNRLISDPFFLKSRSPRRMIFLYGALYFHAIHNNGDPLMMKLRFSLRSLISKEITVVGSFNGIVLLVNQHRYHQRMNMILYNPSTGETKMVLDPPAYDSSDKFVYGFGYGTTLADLKIVRIKTTESNFISCDVFNLKDWSWSKLSFPIGDYCIFNFPGTFANGFLYWYAKGIDNDQHFIVALDLKKMVFSNIQIPYVPPIRLGTYNGQLCMIPKTNNNRSELWVMEEHGPGILWTMVCSFKGVSVFSVLCILDDGKILVREQSLDKKLVHKRSTKNLVIYDMLKDSYKKVNASKSFVGGAESLQASEYVESLISPSNICSV